MGQSHQHFTCSFYARKSQKRKKDSQLKQLFAPLGSVGIKAARKHIDEIDPSFRVSSGLFFWFVFSQEEMSKVEAKYGINHLLDTSLSFLK